MILDFGCGSGRIWAQKNEQVIGVDINRSRLEIARKSIQVICCDGRFLPFRDRVFRWVISDSVLEHIQGYRKALVEMKRVTSDGGRCTIIQPVDNDPLFVLARRVVGAWDRDKIYSKFTSGHLLRSMSQSFRISSVRYLPNAPMLGFSGSSIERRPVFFPLWIDTTRSFVN